MGKTLLNCAVVDDSSLQRLLMAKLIHMHPSLNLVGEYKNGVEAKSGLLSNSIDLLFLDIEMPLLSGFDLLDHLPNRPLVIFITGKREYAFRAFDYDAVDYLQKPIQKDRFLNATRKAVNAHMVKNDQGLVNEDFIFVKSSLKKRKVFLSELRYIEALGDYIKLVTEHESIVVLSTMKNFLSQLPQDRFLRIHKSYIVNLNKVQRYGSKTIELEKEKLPLSRARKTALVEALATYANV